MSLSAFFAICAGCIVGNILGRIIVEWHREKDTPKSEIKILDRRYKL